MKGTSDGQTQETDARHSGPQSTPLQTQSTPPRPQSTPLQPQSTPPRPQSTPLRPPEHVVQDARTRHSGHQSASRRMPKPEHITPDARARRSRRQSQSTPLRMPEQAAPDAGVTPLRGSRCPTGTALFGNVGRLARRNVPTFPNSAPRRAPGPRSRRRLSLQEASGVAPGLASLGPAARSTESWPGRGSRSASPSARGKPQLPLRETARQCHCRARQHPRPS